MNALSVKTTTSTGQANAFTRLDATLVDDPSQYDNVLHSGGPDGSRWTLWDLGAVVDISDVGFDYSGAMGGGYAAFSTDGLTFTGEVGPFGDGGSGATASLPALIDGMPRATARFVGFRAASPGAGKAICETFVYVAGVRVLGPAALPSPPAVPTLAAVPVLIGNVPTIMLSGS